MKIYRCSYNSDVYRSVLPLHPNDLGIFGPPDGQPIGKAFGSTWKPIDVYVYIHDDKKKTKSTSQLEADFYSGWGEPMLASRAIDVLENIFEQYGELLPLNCSDGKQYAKFWCTKFCSAFDETRSEFERFPSGIIGHITKYAFLPEQIGDCEMFRDSTIKSFFVTDRLKMRVEAAGLIGISFVELWSDDPAELAKIYEES
jgi:hypothetical protein